MAEGSPSTLMLVIPARLHIFRGRLYFDAQACNGLRCWLDNFDRLILCAPLVDVDRIDEGMGDVRALFSEDRLSIHPLPLAYTPPRFLAAVLPVIRLLTAQMDRATHYQFAIGGSWGDWGALAAIVAHRRGLNAAVWTDRVESDAMRIRAYDYRGLRHLYRRINAWLAARLERFVIRRSALGLFHGMNVFAAFARFSPEPHLAHNIHLGPEYRIDPGRLVAKAERREEPLRIVYAGRVHPDKAPLEWIEALRLVDGRVNFEATWHGDGPGLEEAREAVREAGLGDCVRFPGHVGDRDALMAALREADLFLFCHQTLESPRCLIEALLSGTPIIGYDSRYAADLIAAHGGGVLTPHDPVVLAEAVVRLGNDREGLAALFAAAAADGHPLVDSAVFEHRAALIKGIA